MTTPNTIEQYGKRMKQFIQDLNDTNIKIVYFDINLKDITEIGKPYLITDLKTINIHNNKFYINSGPYGQWTYTYKPSAMAYLFTRHDTKIKAFLGTVEYSKAFEGGNMNVMDIVHIGNHFTVGLRENKKTKDISIVSHFTSYSEQDTSPLTFDVERTPDCTLPLLLERPITFETECKNYVSVGKCYEKAPILIEVMEELRKVFIGQHGGYIVEGPRGGRYTIQNGVKRYLSHPKKTQTGGGGLHLTDEIIQMIYEIIVQPVTEKYLKEDHQFVHTKLIYDTNNHFHAEKRQVIFMYNIVDHNTCAVFYVEVATIFEAVKEYAYKKKITNRKPSQKATRCYEELIALPTIHLNTLSSI